MPEGSESNQSFALQLIYPEQSGMFARIAQTIGQHGGDLGRIDMLGPKPRLTTRGISIRVRDEHHLERIVAAVRQLDKVKVVEVSEPAGSTSPVPGRPPASALRRARRTLEKSRRARTARRRFKAV